jgi:hypothetical protein
MSSGLSNTACQIYGRLVSFTQFLRTYVAVCNHHQPLGMDPSTTTKKQPWELPSTPAPYKKTRLQLHRLKLDRSIVEFDGHQHKQRRRKQHVLLLRRGSEADGRGAGQDDRGHSGPRRHRRHFGAQVALLLSPEGQRGAGRRRSWEYSRSAAAVAAAHY